jgi:hypothetical protein
MRPRVNPAAGPIDQRSKNSRIYEVSAMSRAKCSLLIAFATVPLIAFSSSGASAFGRGGFGFHPGFGGYGAVPYGYGYGAPGPAYVAAPDAYGPPHGAKNKEKSKNKEVKLHQHHGWHSAAIERRSSPPAVFRAASAPAATPAPPAAACLTKEYLTDRSVVFKDTCTKESASASGPVSATAGSAAAPTRPTPRATQSIRLEPVTAQDDMAQQMDGP